MKNFIDERLENYKKYTCKTYRSFKQKNLKYSSIITESFNFVFAGVCSIFIIYQKKKYILVCSGFTFDGINIFFGKNRYMRYPYDTLYLAISAFNGLIREITSSMDWFTKDYFDSCEFYNYADEELFR